MGKSDFRRTRHETPPAFGDADKPVLAMLLGDEVFVTRFECVSQGCCEVRQVGMAQAQDRAENDNGRVKNSRHSPFVTIRLACRRKTGRMS